MVVTMCGCTKYVKIATFINMNVYFSVYLILLSSSSSSSSSSNNNNNNKHVLIQETFDFSDGQPDL